MHVNTLFGNNKNVNIHIKLIDTLPFGKQTRRAIDMCVCVCVWVCVYRKWKSAKIDWKFKHTILRVHMAREWLTILHYWLTKSWIGINAYPHTLTHCTHWCVIIILFFSLFSCCDVKSQTVYICIQKFV